jgi:hypothetical protein
MKYTSSEVEVLKCIRDEKMAIGRDSDMRWKCWAQGQQAAVVFGQHSLKPNFGLLLLESR